MRVMVPLLRLQALIALAGSATQAIHVGAVMSYGTRTHVTPLFDGLRPLVQLSPDHHITYVCSSLSASFASNHLDVVQVANTGITYDEHFFDSLKREMGRTDKAIATTDVVIRLLEAIGERYEETLQVYLQKFQSRQFDLVICDFFDRACMDAALESGTTYAIASPLGMFGVGDAWFVPNLLAPVPMETWIRSPLMRAKALWTGLPVIRFIMKEEARTKAIRDNLAFQTSSSYTAHFEQNLLLCSNIIGVDPARAIPPNIVAVGSSLDEKTMPPLQPELERQLQQFEDDSVSVAYIAFGTAVNLADCQTTYAKIAQGIDKLLSRQPKMAVIWSSKYQDTAVIKMIQDKHPGRFLTPTWVEQSRLLLHNAVKVFMSHGGYGSLTEALFAGKPLLIMPFVGDQFLNANNAESAGVAAQLHRLTFTSDEMATALTTIMQQYVDPTTSVARNAARMKTIVRLSSEIGKSVLTNTVLMAATVGTAHLVPRDATLSIIDRFPLWLIGGSLGVVLVLLYTVKHVVAAMYHKIQAGQYKIKQI